MHFSVPPCNAGFSRLEIGLGSAELGFAQDQVGGLLSRAANPLPLLLSDGGFFPSQFELVASLGDLGFSLFGSELVVTRVYSKEQVALGKGTSGLEFRGFPNYYAPDLGNQIDLGVGADRALSLDYDLDFLRWSGNGLDQRTRIDAFGALRRFCRRDQEEKGRTADGEDEDWQE